MAEQETRQLLVRAPSELFDRIDAWRREQTDLPGRAEAVRRLLELALADRRKRKAGK